MDPSGCIKLNIGGKLFMTTTDTLNTLPNTRLGRLAKPTTTTITTKQPHNELFFDRNPDIINSILDLYRTGELHLPRNLCGNMVERELKFWEIPTELIRECCFKGFEEHKDDSDIIEQIDKFLTVPYETTAQIQTLSAWSKIWLIMERPKLCRASKIWSTIFFTIVVLSVLLYSLETSMTFRVIQPWFYAQNFTIDNILPTLDLKDLYGISKAKPWLCHFQKIIFAFFILEFLVRLITCPRKKYFFKQAKNWLDIFLLLQNGMTIFLGTFIMKIKSFNTWTDTTINVLQFFYSLSVLRVLRILYLAKSIDTIKILLLSTKASMKVLVLLAICLLSLATMFGAFVFLAEIMANKLTFHSLHLGMWYAIVTMTTVGYGDIVPVSMVGRILGIICALCGVIVTALPITIIASRFTKYHDNIAARQQMKNREAFLHDHPGFCTRKNKKKGESEPLLPGAKHVQRKYPKNSKEEALLHSKQPEVKKKSEDSFCSKWCVFKRRQRKVTSQSIWMTEFKSSPPVDHQGMADYHRQTDACGRVV